MNDHDEKELARRFNRPAPTQDERLDEESRSITDQKVVRIGLWIASIAVIGAILLLGVGQLLARFGVYFY